MSLVVAGMCLAGSTWAANFYWDTTGSTAGFGTASGTWLNPTPGPTVGWSTDATGASAIGSVTTTTSDILYFGTDTAGLAAGTVTIGAAVVNVGNIYFGKASGDITLTGGDIAMAGGDSLIRAPTGGGSVSTTHTINNDINKTSGTLRFGTQNTGNEHYIVNGVLSGGFNLDGRMQNGSGLLELNGLNTFSGNLSLVTGQINANTLSDSGSASSLGAGSSISMGGGGGQQPRLVYTGTAATSTDRSLVVNSTATAGIIAQNGAVDFSGSVSAINGGRNLGLTGTADTGINTVSGVMSDGTGTLNVRVADFGAVGVTGEDAYWRFTGNNTYTGTTTLDDGSTLELAGAGQLGGGTYSSTLSINDSSTFHYDGDNLQILDGVVQGSGTGGILATGAGQLRIIFSSANTNFDGPVTVDGGSLQFRNTADLQVFDASDLNIEGGGALAIQSSVGGANRTVLNNKTWTFDNGGGTLTFNNGNHLFQGGGSTHNFVVTADGSGSLIQSINGGFMNMQGSGNIIFDVADGAQDRDLTLSAHFNNGLITKNGAGTLAITGTHSGSNGITINDGTLEVGDSATLAGGTFTAAIANDGIFKHSSDQVQTISGNITGSGTLEKIDGAALTLSGNNTYSGSTTLGDGTTFNSVIRAGSTTGLSSSSAFTINSDGTLTLDGFSNTIGSLAGAGNVRNDGATDATLTTGGDNSSTTFSGILTDGPGVGSLSLVKQGSGTMSLSGANQYTGTTTVNAGTLLINGDNSLATGNYTVSGGTLGGEGTIGGSTTVTGTGFLSPGDGGIGTLTLNDTLTISGAAGGPDGSMLFDLGGSLSGDLVDMSSSALTIGSGLLDLDDFVFTGLGYLGSGTFTLFDAGSISGTLGSNTSGTILGGSYEATLSIVGDNIVLDLISLIAPEPDTLFLAIIGGALLYRQRRQRHFAASAGNAASPPAPSRRQRRRRRQRRLANSTAY